jgi:Flp pilus assembly pilin Flp
MRQLLVRFIQDDRGQDLVEYAFLAIFLALAVTVGLQALGSGLNTHFTNVGNQVSGS